MRRLFWTASCALFLLLLSSLFRAPNVPVPAVALLAVAAFAAFRPGAALVIVAAVVPVAAWLGWHWSGAVAWPETVAVAYLAGYAARQAIETDRPPADAFVYAIHAMIAVIVGSLSVELLFLHATLGGESLRHVVWQLVSRDYFIGDGGFEAGDAAMRLLEGVLLAHAGATFAKRSDTFGPRLVRALVIGAAMASVLTLWRLWGGALRQDNPVLAFLRFLATMRFNLHYADVNAAGSYYVMALLPALALTLARMRWSAAAVVIGLSLALTGSRAAFVAGAAALSIVWIRSRQLAGGRDPGPGHRWIRRAGLALLVLACAGMLYAGFTRNVTPVGRALELRKEFTLTGLRMLASRPLFGVGIGEYRKVSSEFSSAQIQATFPNENAHNNFLQVLAELGGIGFAAFATLLLLAARRTARLRSTDASAVAAGVAAGLLAFVLTWVAGHPLLVDEPALTFWLLLGTAVGWGSATLRQPGPAAPAIVRWGAVAVLLVLAVSIPSRARVKFDAANLEHMGIGLSAWHVGADGVRYRMADATSTVFVPADAPAITVPLRGVPPETVLEVQLFLDGRHANSVSVPSDMWRVVAVPIPQGRDRARFLTLQLHVANMPSGADVLMIGKVDPLPR